MATHTAQTREELAVRLLEQQRLGYACVDCGRITAWCCEHCFAAERFPSKDWVQEQRTPLCIACENSKMKCHFCHEMSWVTPPDWDFEYFM